MQLSTSTIDRAVAAALEEDLGDAGDVTTDSVVPESLLAQGRFVARRALVVAGLPVAHAVYRALDPSVEFRPQCEDGAPVLADRVVAHVRGPARAILRGERTALNFLGRMSGIATAARAAVEEVAGTRARILDTRKTAPGLRLLDKYAVAVGGGTNHRMGLYDAVLIKDTHLGAGVSIGEAVRRAVETGRRPGDVTVEVRDLEQLGEAIAAGAGRALLDNMDLAEIERAVRFASGRIELEVSGGLRPGGLRPVAETGVDYLSLGWLTHSAPAADLALEMEKVR